MAAFSVVWLGQLISLLGTGMTSFALTIWAFQAAPEERRATVFSLLWVAYFIPTLLLSPIAGSIVDRLNRKWLMILSDLGAGLTTLAILYLYTSGNLQVWHLFISNFLEGLFQTIQWPAYSAAITMLVEKKHYARTSALTQLAGNTSNILAPLLAGGVLGFTEPYGILIVLGFDIVSFLIAIGALLLVRIPQPTPSVEGRSEQGSLLREITFGFRFIFQRPGLLGLQTTILLGNFFYILSFTLLAPMVLARSGGNTLTLGSVQTISAIGGVLGGVILSAWGGPQRKTLGVALGFALVGWWGIFITGLGQSLPLWAVGMFFATFFLPLIDSSSQAIWQSKVAPDIQGRVFAARRMIAWLANPIGAALAGPLADSFLEPGMRTGGELANIFGWLVGTGPGAGMALLFLYAGVAILLVGLISYAIPAIAFLEDILPDHDSRPPG